MDPTLEEKQSDQTQEKKSGGGIGQGINAINNLMGGGIKNPFGKIGLKVATQTTLRGFAAFLASPAGLPILITIVLVIVFTVVIMGFGGAPAIEPTQVQTPTPTPPAVP